MAFEESEGSLEKNLETSSGQTLETNVQHRKKYELIVDTIKQRIDDGGYEPFQQLSRKQFAGEFNASESTVSMALLILRKEGYIIGHSNKIFVYGDEDSSAENPMIMLHEKIAKKIRVRVNNGFYQPGVKLPTIDDLISDQEIGGSRVTVLNAIELLKQEGLLTARRGSGIFVNPYYKNTSTEYGR